MFVRLIFIAAINYKNIFTTKIPDLRYMCHFFFWPVAHLRTRTLYTAINSRRSWCDVVSLLQNAREELQFWFRNIDCFNGIPIWFSPGATRIVYLDASDSGYGGYVVELGPKNCTRPMVRG